MWCGTVIDKLTSETLDNPGHLDAYLDIYYEIQEMYLITVERKDIQLGIHVEKMKLDSNLTIHMKIIIR